MIFEDQEILDSCLNINSISSGLSNLEFETISRQGLALKTASFTTW